MDTDERNCLFYVHIWFWNLENVKKKNIQVDLYRFYNEKIMKNG